MALYTADTINKRFLTRVACTTRANRCVKKLSDANEATWGDLLRLIKAISYADTQGEALLTTLLNDSTHTAHTSAKAKLWGECLLLLYLFIVGWTIYCREFWQLASRGCGRLQFKQQTLRRSWSLRIFMIQSPDAVEFQNLMASTLSKDGKILMTIRDRQTDKQTDRRCVKHNLLGGGDNMKDVSSCFDSKRNQQLAPL